MNLGLVTYQMAQERDVDTIIANCREAGFAGVELRTTYAHGVEETLSKNSAGTFEDSGIRAYGLGTAFEFHSPDAAELRDNSEATKLHIDLAVDLGMEGVKVRPNALCEGLP